MKIAAASFLLGSCPTLTEFHFLFSCGTYGSRLSAVNPLTAPAPKFSGRKVHTYKLANSVFDGPVTTYQILCILVDILSHADAKRRKGLNDFKFGTSIGHFS